MLWYRQARAPRDLWCLPLSWAQSFNSKSFSASCPCHSMANCDTCQSQDLFVRLGSNSSNASVLHRSPVQHHAPTSLAFLIYPCSKRSHLYACHTHLCLCLQLCILPITRDCQSVNLCLVPLSECLGPKSCPPILVLAVSSAPVLYFALHLHLRAAVTCG